MANPKVDAQQIVSSMEYDQEIGVELKEVEMRDALRNGLRRAQMQHPHNDHFKTLDGVKDWVKHKFLPIHWPGGWDGDTEAMSFYDCQFLETIGPFKEGDVVPCLTVDWESGHLFEYNSAGDVLRECRVKLVERE